MDITRCQYMLGMTKGRISNPTINTNLGIVK
jgi:hypothetical protein